MELRNAIGIDPDSKGFVCAYVKLSQEKADTKGYMATDSDLKHFLHWVKAEKDPIVAIEGSNGLSKPIEKALREEGIIFYSFKPSDTDKFRKAVLGQNKDNKKDAEAVARYAMALATQQGKLERYRRVWFADAELQLLTRSYQSNSEAMTAEVNRLWKLLRLASPELYLTLGGNNPEVELSENILKTQGILTLLSQKPDIGQWKSLSEEQLLQAMGGGNYKGREKLIQELRKVAGNFQPISLAMAMMIGNSAHQIQWFKRKQSEITRMLEVLTGDTPAVQVLTQMRGIATVTAATMIAEIIDIRRFAREYSLACYSGLGMKEHSTGDTFRMVPSQLFNHRLKDAFMTAARNVVLYNPDSHLAGYYRNLVKAGMSFLEARKRVARALVRVIYRKLSALNEESVEATEGEEHTEGESDMASGLTRSDRGHTSDISLSSPRTRKVREPKRVKGGATQRARSKARGRK